MPGRVVAQAGRRRERRLRRPRVPERHLPMAPGRARYGGRSQARAGAARSGHVLAGHNRGRRRREDCGHLRQPRPVRDRPPPRPRRARRARALGRREAHPRRDPVRRRRPARRARAGRGRARLVRLQVALLGSRRGRLLPPTRAVGAARPSLRRLEVDRGRDRLRRDDDPPGIRGAAPRVLDAGLCGGGGAHGRGRLPPRARRRERARARPCARR